MIDKLSILIKDSDNLSDDEKSTILSAKEDVSAFLTKALITALRCRNVMGEKLTTIFSRGANSFDVIEDDIFKYSFNNRKKEHNITVIPVNSSFDTVITRKFENDSFPLISASTLHGKWIDRLIKSGLTVSEIDSMINESIIKRKIKAINHNAGAENSKQTNYPIGTVLPVEYANSMYYLLVISYFDENNVAHSTIADIEKALISLIEFYDIFGQGDDMYLPLLGTGRSRAGMSYQEAYDLIKKVVAEHPERIQGHVHLVVTKDVTIEY